MKALNMIAIILLIVGGLNWGVYGLFGWDLGTLLGGMDTPIARIVYILVGLSALWILVMDRKILSSGNSMSSAPMGGQSM